jgi:hypothetical protein
LTYATKAGSSLHKPCEITWFPYLKKYLVMADTCTGCSDKQIDIWIGDGNGGQAETDCENNSPSGGGHHLIRDGSHGHKANSTFMMFILCTLAILANVEIANALWSKSKGCQVKQNIYPKGN